ncbi:molybdenum cofactor guanylyltransferase MobA [Aliikangiella maris]|uniref:Molybdenum cofactor guanylyltransferase MobA n=2 Tax=Aliikangiella maris TaxID=3162458 RepID=A0ABV2BPL3_9GAMM
MIDKSFISGLILSGGAGRRLEGKDKGLQQFQQKPLIEHQIDWLADQVGELIISANRHLVTYQQYGYLVVTDQREGYAGPLAGIEQGLQIMKNDWLFVLPVDVPLLPKILIHQLVQQIQFSDSAYYLVTDVREHYLCMLLNRSCHNTVSQLLNQKTYRVRDFLKQIKATPVNLNIEESAFRNLNYLADYQSV